MHTSKIPHHYKVCVPTQRQPPAKLFTQGFPGAIPGRQVHIEDVEHLTLRLHLQ